MSDPIVDFSDTPDAPRRRGRPRSQDTITRDQRVITILRDQGPRTREQLVAELGIKPTHVYLSLWRLKRENLVERVTSGAERHTWQVIA